MNARASTCVEGLMRPLFLFLALPLLVVLPDTATAQTTTPTPFDRAAAANALDRNFEKCLPGDAPVVVVVTFAPTGTIESIVDPASGSTPVTTCVEGMLAGVRIPAFTGPAVRVRKKIDGGSRSRCAELFVGSAYRWSPVLVDGTNVGQTALLVRVSEGEHQVTWQRPDGSPASRNFTFKCGHRVALMLYPDRDPKVAEYRLPGR